MRVEFSKLQRSDDKQSTIFTVVVCFGEGSKDDAVECYWESQEIVYDPSKPTPCDAQVKQILLARIFRKLELEAFASISHGYYGY